MDSTNRWTYGIAAVAMGLLVIVICFGIAVWQYEQAADAGAVLAAITGTVGSIVGAYFGVQAGSAGKEKSDQQASQMRVELGREKDKSQMLASALPEEKAASIIQSFL